MYLLRFRFMRLALLSLLLSVPVAVNAQTVRERVNEAIAAQNCKLVETLTQENNLSQLFNRRCVAGSRRAELTRYLEILECDRLTAASDVRLLGHSVVQQCFIDRTLNSENLDDMAWIAENIRDRVGNNNILTPEALAEVDALLAYMWSKPEASMTASINSFLGEISDGVGGRLRAMQDMAAMESERARWQEDRVSIELTASGIFFEGTYVHATVAFGEPLFPNDHLAAENWLPDEFSLFASRYGADGEYEPKFSDDILRNVDFPSSYSSRQFENIILIEQTAGPYPLDNSDGKVFLLQATHSSSRLTYYFWLGEAGRVGSRGNAFLIGRQLYSLYLVNMTNSDFQEHVSANNGTEILASETKISLVGKLMVSRNDETQTFLFNTTFLADHIQEPEFRDAFFEHLEEDQEAQRQSEEIEAELELFRRQVHFRAVQQIVRPWCDVYAPGMIALMGGVGVEGGMDSSVCTVRHLFGSISFQVYAINRLECSGNTCQFNLIFDCSSRGAAMLQACGEFKDEMRQTWPSGRIPGEATMSERGSVVDISVDFVVNGLE